TELFERAVDLPATERSAFLARECGDDAALREEVESLLTHDAEASQSFMRTPDRPDVGQESEGGRRTATTGQADRFLGQRIGRYRIKSVIASGGMGTVYLAEQDRPRRDVALKVIQAGVASRDALRRFEFESQVLARLRHPNIAHVYEAGVHEPEASDGPPVPYFAMEFIPDARLITRHADERKLDARQRLALFAKVCDAVHHGHQKGVIHRDLKPGNILVDAAGEPKVIDFGVARSTDSDVAVTTMRTDVGQLIGTIQYMSPEQCDADPHEIDTRSDVYSLGVVLYELLTGARPYDTTGTSIYRATRLIKEVVPPSPSSIKRQLRGDIETIILKAIEKDPARRYQSAVELGNDIRHVLRREPIEASAPTLWSRTVRWVSRHPVAGTTALATVVALIIIALLPSVTWWYGSRIPHEVIVSHDRTRADLVSLAGKTLHTWDTGGIVEARLITHENARYVVIGFSPAARTPFARKLCVFDARGPYDKPIWTSTFAEDQIPQIDRDGFTPEDFFVAGIETFDVFPDIDGPEIVAAFANRYSWRALRIYSLDGRLLYQVWHDGWLNQFYWMSNAKVLIVTGDNHECYWEDRGFSKYKRPVPQVVFGLRPWAGFISKKLLDVYCSEGDNCPVWYRYVAPPHLTDIMDANKLQVPEHSRFDPGDHVALEFVLNSDPKVGANWIIDAKGRLVFDEILTNDAFNRLENPPDLSDFHLADIRELPPCADAGR
ncbi:MAG: protein kinase, partial [Planctomycetes bacterium]|nr:protein kinase [Planctomycetota bacterium]